MGALVVFLVMASYGGSGALGSGSPPMSASASSPLSQSLGGAGSEVLMRKYSTSINGVRRSGSGMGHNNNNNAAVDALDGAASGGVGARRSGASDTGSRPQSMVDVTPDARQRCMFFFCVWCKIKGRRRRRREVDVVACNFFCQPALTATQNTTALDVKKRIEEQYNELGNKQIERERQQLSADAINKATAAKFKLEQQFENTMQYKEQRTQRRQQMEEVNIIEPFFFFPSGCWVYV